MRTSTDGMIDSICMKYNIVTATGILPCGKLLFFSFPLLVSFFQCDIVELSQLCFSDAQKFTIFHCPLPYIIDEVR